MTDLRVQFGARLKAARLRAGLTQGKLASLCGWGEKQGRIGNYEAGARWPDLQDVVKLAKHVHSTPQHLLFDEAPADNDLGLTPAALAIARQWDALPDPAKEFIALLIDNIVRFQNDNEMIAKVIFANTDRKRHAEAIKRIEQWQRTSRR